MRDSLMATCHQVKQDISHAPNFPDLVNDGDVSRHKRKAAYTAIQAQIGERLRWARELVEPNRAEFARALGIDRTTVQKIEDGNRAPSVFNILEFAHTLRVTPDYLLLGAMRGVDGELAARLAAAHPELARPPTLPFWPDSPGTATDGDSGTKPKKPRKKRGAA